jgi:HEPN domain-containing protein
VKPAAAEWVEIAERDALSAESLLRDSLRANGAYSCQQSVEKLVKGSIVEQRDTEPPRTHDLVELADLAGLRLTQEQRLFLIRLTDHSVRARYLGGE